MLGIEIVQSKASKAPAPAAASYIKEAMLKLRVLMTVDGPNANVLKIKPPMVFAEPDADRMLAVMKQARAHPPPPLRPQNLLAAAAAANMHFTTSQK